jgi:hypothetical protein
MWIVIKHGDGEAQMRSDELARRLRTELPVDVREEDADAGHMTIYADGVPIAWRRGGALEHAVGLGWPDADRVIAQIRRRLDLPSLPATASNVT